MFIIHIGRNKAGSTTLQGYLSSHKRAMRKAGVTFPKLVRPAPAGHQFWARSLRGNSARAKEDRALYAAAFSELAARPPSERIFLSSEFLLNLDPSGIRALRDELAGHAVRIILYLRDYPSWTTSIYNQMTKKGDSADDFDAVFERLLGNNLADFPAQLAAWADTFGDAAMHIRSLDRASLKDGDLIEDALSVAGLDRAAVAAKGGADDDAEDERRNVSPPWPAIEIARAIAAVLQPFFAVDRGFGRRSEDFRRLIRNVVAWQATLGGDEGRVQYLTPAQFDAAMRRYRDDVAFANTRMRGYAIPEPDLAPPPTERPFLPSIAQVPAAQRRGVAERLAEHDFVRELPADLRTELIRRIGG